MPPALAIAALGLGTMIDQNVQSKAAIKNAQNAETTAQGNVTKNQATAQSGLQNYLGANPGTAQPGNAPTAPTYSGANIPIAGAPAGRPGPGMMALPGAGGPGPGMTAAGGGAGQLSPQQLMAMLQQLKTGTA